MVTAVTARSVAASFVNSVDLMWEKVDSVNLCPFQHPEVIVDLVPSHPLLERHTASRPRAQRREVKW